MANTAPTTGAYEEYYHKPEPPPPYNATVTSPPIHPAPPYTARPVIITQPIIAQPARVILTSRFGNKPLVIICPSCNTQNVTRVENMPSVGTHLMAVLLCVLGCWPCFFVPYCMETCYNVDHYCTNCNAYMGSYQN